MHAVDVQATPTGVDRMKAIVRDRYGSADGLELRDVDTPEIADDEVLVRVHAAGVDRGVWHVMTGLPYPIRLAGYGLRAPKNPVLGADVAGVVEAVGSRRDEVPARRRGVRHRQGHLRRVRARVREQAGAQAGEPLLRAGRRGRHLRPDRAAGPARPRAGPARPAGADHRCLRRRGDLRRAAGQGLRGRGDRGVQHGEGRPGPFAGRRPRHRLHAATTSPHPGSATTSSSTSAGTRRWHACDAPSPRRARSSSPEARPTAAGSAAPTASSGRSLLSLFIGQKLDDVRLLGEPRGPARAHRTSSNPGRSRRSSTGPTRSARPPRPSGTSSRGTPAAKSPSPSSEPTRRVARDLRIAVGL